MKHQTSSIAVKTQSKSTLRELWENIKVIILGIVIVIIFRSFLYEPYRIPSESMLPTLEVGDFIIVEKFTYGFSQFSFPFGLLSFDGRLFGSEPKRGDVAVFRKPTDTSIPYVKRIIGLPGDTVEIRSGRLIINGILINRNKVDAYDVPGGKENISRYWEDGDDLSGHEIIELYGDTSPYDNTNIYKVPDNHYFVMGDNRDNSLDSRFLQLTGTVPFDNLVGKPIFVLLSFNASKPFGNWFNTSRFTLSIV